MMKNKYVEFVSDEHLLSCIESLHNSYSKAKANISKQKFYKNKIDSIKLIFDAKFNDLAEEDLIKNEINRQVDKSINNSIGTFHEQVLGGVSGFERGNLSGYDIKANDDSLFADIKNKHNTMNSSAAESLYQKLKQFADKNKLSKCYWVQIWAKSSFHENWFGDINGKEYNHSRVYKISGDKFYELVTGRPNALFELYKALPYAIDDFLAKHASKTANKQSALDEIAAEATASKRNILDQISFENFGYYSGFDKLK